MKATEKRLDIDRWQYRVECGCGCGGFKWACERWVAVSFPCGSREGMDGIKAAFEEGQKKDQG